MTSFFVDPDISVAKTIDSSIYTSEDVFAQTKKKIFASSWQFIGSSSLVEEKESCYPFFLLKDFLDEPLLLTKDSDGKIHCLSNVCTHRGNLLVYDACKSINLKCKYHGRIFSLNGKFKSMPGFKEVKNFPSAEDDLHELDVFNWKNLLFTSLSSTFPAENFLKDMMKRVDWLPIEEFRFRPQLSKEFYIDANWALYCENYLEGFHIPFVHAGLNSVIDYNDYETHLFFPFSSLQIGISKTGEDCFDLPGNSPDYPKRIAAYYFWVFPNMMFNFYPWGLSINIVEPITVSRTKVSFHCFVWKDEKRNSGAGANLDRVELEDEEIVQKVQQGVRSSFYKHGRYSVTKEKGTHHFHMLLAEFLNEGLRV